ncbi:MAG: alpha/beta hydrolase, partial [Pseudomonadota bacterium]
GVLHGLGMPVAVVHGLQDALVPVQAARAMAGALSGAHWLPVAGGGHALPVVHAALLAATIEALATGDRHPTPEPLPAP